MSICRPRARALAAITSRRWAGSGSSSIRAGRTRRAAFAWMQYFNSGDYTDPAIGDAKIAAGAQPARGPRSWRAIRTTTFLRASIAAFPYTVPYLMQIPEANAIQALMGERMCADFVNGREGYRGAALKAMDDRTRRLMEDGGYYG